jgi:hypothetical protein
VKYLAALESNVFVILTLWNKVLLEKPIIAQPVKNFPVFNGTQRFITVFTRARRRSLPRAIWIQSTPSQPLLLKSILILSSLLRWGLQVVYFPHAFQPKFCKHFSGIIHVRMALSKVSETVSASVIRVDRIQWSLLSGDYPRCDHQDGDRVSETLFYDILTRLIAREDFIKFSPSWLWRQKQSPKRWITTLFSHDWSPEKTSSYNIHKWSFLGGWEVVLLPLPCCCQ